MSQSAKNVLYAQAGGVTAVINTSAVGVIEMVKSHPNKFNKIYAAENGIKGILEENLIDITNISTEKLDNIKRQPGAVFKACRFDLDSYEDNPAQYQRLLNVFHIYQIGYFFYNGGNGSMLTAQKVADYCTENGHPMICIGVPKTIDNDLALSHCSPGFGSSAKYIASSLLEATIDLYSMHNTSTKFFIMEVMGRNTGWLAISGGLIKKTLPDVPLLILPAERQFNKEKFLAKVKHFFDTKSYCVCIVSEGLTDEKGEYLTVKNIEYTRYGTYTQLGGVAQNISKIVAEHFNCKTHSAMPNYLQRSASLLVSQTDWNMAFLAGKAAVQAALDGEHGVLPVIELTGTNPFAWQYKNVRLIDVASLEKRVPDEYLTADGMDITPTALDYLLPLIQGERQQTYKHGLPDIKPLTFQTVKKQLPAYIV